MRIIAGHRPVGIDGESTHKTDNCPECGGLKKAQSALCQDCYLQHHKDRRARRAQMRKNARAWALRQAGGDALRLRPGPQMSFEQFWEALRGAAVAVRKKYPEGNDGLSRNS
jgi:hypothetical protein